MNLEGRDRSPQSFDSGERTMKEKGHGRPFELPGARGPFMLVGGRREQQRSLPRRETAGGNHPDGVDGIAFVRHR